MVSAFGSVVILDGIFLVAGIILSMLKTKHKINQRIVDAPWEIIKLVTAAFVGYQFGTGRIL